VKHLPNLLPEMLEQIKPYIHWALNSFLPGINIDFDAVADLILENVMPLLFKAQEINLGSLGVIGGAGLLVTFILAIDTIETNMNIVWDVHEARGYGQKIVIFIPFLLLFAGGIGIFSMFLSYMRDILEKILVQQLPFGKFGELLVNLSIPFALLILLFISLWLLYCYMPYVPGESGFFKAAVEKTKKRWLASLISAVFTFVAIAIFGAAMIFVQASMFARLSLFYGSLAFFPMLMFLVFGFWCIVLYGNALCWRITERNLPRGYFYHRILKLTDRWRLKNS
jgi:membrane protein